MAEFFPAISSDYFVIYEIANQDNYYYYLYSKTRTRYTKLYYLFLYTSYDQTIEIRNAFVSSNTKNVLGPCE